MPARIYILINIFSIQGDNERAALFKESLYLAHRILPIIERDKESFCATKTTAVLGCARVEICGKMGWLGLKSLRAYPNNRVVMRPGEKDEAKAAGQDPRRRS
jgi:hypothetical protein